MDYKRIQELLRYFEASTLTTLHVEDGDFRLSVSKLTTPLSVPGEGKPIITNVDLAMQNPSVKDQVILDPDAAFLRQVKSPLVGTYYGGSAPDSEPFVKLGQTVKKGDTLCIVEAMKIMNEIASPFAGVIEKINVKNGDVIGFDKVLMVIRVKE